MKLTVLGSGTCVPSLKRNAPGYLLEVPGCQALIDCGSGTLLQLERSGKSYKDLDAVFITHRHPDHFADLMPLIQALLCTPNFSREKDFTIFSSGAFINYYNMSIGPVLGEPGSFQVLLSEIHDDVEFGPFHVSSTKTSHSHDSIAYRFEHNGKAVVFTGDADYDQEIISLSEGADILVADCSFPDSMKVAGHLSAGECGLVARQAGVKKLVLSHLYPVSMQDTDCVKEAGMNYNGDIVLAEDLMEFKL